jgi:hypothetical protein
LTGFIRGLGDDLEYLGIGVVKVMRHPLPALLGVVVQHI